MTLCLSVSNSTLSEYVSASVIQIRLIYSVFLLMISFINPAEASSALQFGAQHGHDPQGESL